MMKHWDAFRDGTTLFAGMNFWSPVTSLCRLYRFYKELSLSTNSVILNPVGSLLFKNIDAECLKTCFKYDLVSTVPSARWK